jgi:hypothetical protein
MKSPILNARVSQFAIAALLAMSAGIAGAADTKVVLTGAEETPPVTTSATGNGTISVNDDKSIAGGITVKNLNATAAHIHLGGPGKKGPPVVTLDKVSGDVWHVPAGSKLTDEQYASYKAGDLYINVHTAENKGGEIRGQIKPQ